MLKGQSRQMLNFMFRVYKTKSALSVGPTMDGQKKIFRIARNVKKFILKLFSLNGLLIQPI
jgi:hypothetical protein